MGTVRRNQRHPEKTPGQEDVGRREAGVGAPVGTGREEQGKRGSVDT